MKEKRFIAQNKQKWQEAESLLDSPVKDPEKLSNLFVQVVDDLSYSRTYYPNRSVRVYLNKIARQYFSLIYTKKKTKHSQFKLFWTDELPQIVLYCKRELLISLLVFLAAIAIGVFSSIKDPQFVNAILGDSYVAMTEKNINSGDPMAVYKQTHQLNMFLGITLNNLMVAFRTYVLGIFLAIGTLASLLSNGVMVGCFQYYFLERGLFWESSLAIWLHGTLELSSIVLAGGAGLTLGRGLIFPGTYSRLQSLQISGVRSLKLMLGVAPVLVLAAIIESFLTRYTGAPVFLKAILIFLSAAFIVGYFVIYPRLKAKKGFLFPLKETQLLPSHTEPTNFGRIKTNADVLKDTFHFYARQSSQLFPLIFAVSACTSLFFMFLEEQRLTISASEWWIDFFSEMFYALHTPNIPFIFINSLAASAILYRVMDLVDKEWKQTDFRADRRSFAQLFIITSIVYSSIYLGALGVTIVLVGFGMLIFIGFVQLTEKSNLLNAFGQGWDLFTKNNTQGMGLQMIVLLLSFSFLLILYAPLRYIHMSVIRWNFSASDPWSQKVIRFLELFVKTSSSYMILPLIAASMCYLYFSQMEVKTAANLKESIGKMSERISRK